MYLPHPRTQSKTPEIPLFNALASQACVLLLLLLHLLLRLLLHRTRTDQAGRVGHDSQRVVHSQTHEPPTRPARSETLFPVLSSLHCRPLDKMSETQSTAPTPTPCAPSSRLNPLRLHTANQEKRNRDWLRPTHELGRDPLSTTLHPLPERGSKGGSVVAMLSTSLAPVCAPNIETPPRRILSTVQLLRCIGQHLRPQDYSVSQLRLRFRGRSLHRIAAIHLRQHGR